MSGEEQLDLQGSRSRCSYSCRKRRSSYGSPRTSRQPGARPVRAGSSSSALLVAVDWGRPAGGGRRRPPGQHVVARGRRWYCTPPSVEHPGAGDRGTALAWMPASGTAPPPARCPAPAESWSSPVASSRQEPPWPTKQEAPLSNRGDRGQAALGATAGAAAGGARRAGARVGPTTSRPLPRGSPAHIVNTSIRAQDRSMGIRRSCGATAPARSGRRQ